MKYRSIILASFFAFLFYPCFSQNFEGSISFRTRSESSDRTVVMTAKGVKTVLEVETDSNMVIRIIKDFGTETATLLRSRDELKYGFRIPSIPRTDVQEEYENEKKDLIIQVTDDVQLFGNYNCVKIKLRNSFCEAEAWVTNDVNFSLSHYFPEFLGSGVDPKLNSVRRAADQKGFIMHYHEQQKGINTQKIFEVTLEEKEIPDEAFSIPSDFLVLDQEGMKELLTAAQISEARKKQWDEFQALFGKK